MKPALIAGLLLPLWACTASIDPIPQATQTLDATLLGGSDAEYRYLEAFTGGVVCGEVKVTDAWGQTGGFRPFIVRGALVDKRVTADDRHIYCSHDPAASLYARTGIGPLSPASPALEQVISDLTLIERALGEYLEDTRGLPPNEPGLAVLHEWPAGQRKPLNYREGGYLPAVPADPWGRAYLYEGPRMGGVAGTYRIHTLGADGEPGGRDVDADVGSWHLPYIRHIRGQ